MIGAEAKPPLDGIKHDATGYDGSVFGSFFADRRPEYGPGWYVIGRNAEKYGKGPSGEGAYLSLCGRPDTPTVRARGYNRPVCPGWRTKREATAAAVAMRAHYAA